MFKNWGNIDTFAAFVHRVHLIIDASEAIGSWNHRGSDALKLLFPSVNESQVASDF